MEKYEKIQWDMVQYEQMTLEIINLLNFYTFVNSEDVYEPDVEN